MRYFSCTKLLNKTRECVEWDTFENVFPVHKSIPLLLPSIWVLGDLSADTEDITAVGSIPGLGRPPGEGNGNPLQHSCLRNPMDGEAWQTIVHRTTKNWTRLND